MQRDGLASSRVAPLVVNNFNGWEVEIEYDPSNNGISLFEGSITTICRC